MPLPQIQAEMPLLPTEVKAIVNMSETVDLVGQRDHTGARMGGVIMSRQFDPSNGQWSVELRGRRPAEADVSPSVTVTRSRYGIVHVEVFRPDNADPSTTVLTNLTYDGAFGANVPSPKERPYYGSTRTGSYVFSEFGPRVEGVTGALAELKKVMGGIASEALGNGLFARQRFAVMGWFARRSASRRAAQRAA